MTTQSSFFDDLGNVITEGGSLGIVTFSVLAAFFWAWENLLKRGDIENNKKMIISFLTPILLANAIYWSGALGGGWPATIDTWWGAMKIAGLESLGALGIRGGLGMAEKSLEKRESKPRKRRAKKVQPEGGA